jgi:hypothetical protein
MHKRDFFVTNKHFIVARDALRERFGLVILTPKECVSRLSEMLSSDKATWPDFEVDAPPFW